MRPEAYPRAERLEDLMNSYRLGLSMMAVLMVTGGVAVGCGDDETASTTAATSTTTTTAATTSSAGGAGGGTTTTTTTSGGGQGGQGGGVGGAGGVGGGQGGAGGGMGDCAPEPGDDACVMCTKTNCCDQLMNCQADAACVACTDCLQNMDPIACITAGTCDFNDPVQGPLLMCGQMNCIDMCQ